MRNWAHAEWPHSWARSAAVSPSRSCVVWSTPVDSNTFRACERERNGEETQMRELWRKERRSGGIGMEGGKKRKRRVKEAGS